MRNRWSDEDARKARKAWGPTHGEETALRLYTARLLGGERTLVLHGGGNVSVKTRAREIIGDEIDVIRVKGSGSDMASLTPEGLPALDLERLRRLRGVSSLDDATMRNELRRCLLVADAPTPSVETLVHAFLPHRFVDHSHSDAVLALTNRMDGENLVHEALGTRVAVLPYVYPGFELAKAMADCLEEHPLVEGVVLLHHGLFTFGEDARTAYERHVCLVDGCEKLLRRRTRGKKLRPQFKSKEKAPDLVARVAPVLRGLLARETGEEDNPHRLPLLEWRGGKEILEIVGSAEAKGLLTSGPVTTDHLVRVGRMPVLVEDPPWSDEKKLRASLEKAIAAHEKAYLRYVEKESKRKSVDEETRALSLRKSRLPRVVLLPGAGILAFGETKRAAVVAADITEQTLLVKKVAILAGAFGPLDDHHLFDMEFRPLQRVKVASRDARPLFARVVAISGGAGAIGAAIGRVCVAAGAHVVLCDVDGKRLAPVVAGLEEEHGPGSATAVTMDVTSEASVKKGYEEICRSCGGVDVIVPNAGIAHVAAVEALRVADFRRVLEVNLVGYLLFMQQGIRVLEAQGRGGNIVIQASKNVFGPGKDFGAYSASKAGGHQLGKVAAIELAPLGIRVNMINADAVFGDEEVPSGLWLTVGPDRAKSRGLQEKDLPEYYRERNLLKARVRGHHVGNAVVYFASNQSPTTGATLPVDGGVVEAFPR